MRITSLIINYLRLGTGVDKFEKILSDYKLNFELDNKSNFPSLNKLNNMDLNEKVKRAHDDSDNEKEDDSVVWGSRSRYSREESSRQYNNNNKVSSLAINNQGVEVAEPKKI